MKDQSLLLNNSVPSMESIRNNQILHDDVLAQAQEEKTRMTPSPTCSSKLPSSNHTWERQQKIKDGPVAIDNTHKNDPFAWVWNRPAWLELCPSWQRLGGTEWIPQMNLQNLCIFKGNKYLKLPEKFYLELSFQNVIGRSYFVCFDGKSSIKI